ncbi:ABC transporter permease [Peptoniphilus genitalis]|uniref:ABC transporter permease n=1 Tax=Peptoniphilus genitalis TaxID=3036303 RepID=UPI0024AD1C30|nr:ABC transporter permease [Peptoniphilus sp. Marseille-Q7072]
MNKKNFPIFISLLIVSLFFTVVFYYGYISLKHNNEKFMSYNFYDAEIDGDLTADNIKKLKEIDEIKLVGKASTKPESAKYKNDLIAINYQDQDINKMREFSDLVDGRFAKKDGEIVLSKNIVNKNKLKLGDKINIDFGNRIVDDEVIDADSTLTDKESYQIIDRKEYEIVGVYEDIYNKYSGISYGLTTKNDIKAAKVYLKFNDFEDAYKRIDELQNEVNRKLGKSSNIVLNPELVERYGVEYDFPHNIIANSTIIFAVVGSIALFVFFTKNIFLVWELRKIKELSMYKSIGTTDLQIYLLLLKEGIFLSFLPIILGHFLGYGVILKLFRFLQYSQGTGKFVSNYFSPILSILVIFITFLIVALSIMKPAKKISKISIIDGIKGNLDFYKDKKRKKNNIWRELKINNIQSIKSQRYVSSVGIIIISVIIIIMGMIKYQADYRYFYDGYNILVEYDSNKEEVPKLLNQIKEEIPNQGAYISREKYVQVKNDLDFSKEFKDYVPDDILAKEIGRDYLDGSFIVLEEKDFKSLGGKKGEFILYNMTQQDPLEPISKAKKIPLFSDPVKIKIKFANDYETEIEISKTVSDLGKFQHRTMPNEVKILTDFDTFYRIMEVSNEAKSTNYSYDLRMAVNKEETNDVKSYIEKFLREEISPSDKFSISTELDIKADNEKEQKSFEKLIATIGVIIFLLNVTNGYSSINLSLMNRKKEIGSLYSCGMDTNELKNLYQKEFIIEQLKSFILAILISILVMFVISKSSASFTLKNLLIYYDYKMFLGFSLIVYGIDFLIYYFSLKRILNKPTIELIRVI